MQHYDATFVALRCRRAPDVMFRKLFRAVLDSSIRAVVVVLVAWPLLLVGMLAQARLESAPPAGLVTLYLTVFCAKVVVLALLGRRMG